jgi:phage anti-repressor protein
MNTTYSQQIGTAYEYYVLEQIKNDYEKVWHWKDFPEKLMYENNLINNYEIYKKYRYDIGADLVAFKDNKYYFIQCKNYNDTILMENLAGFYFLLYEYNLTGVLYYNGKLSQRVLDLSTNKIQFINLPFNNLTIDIINNIKIPLIIRDYQQEAYNQLVNIKSCVLSLPCGMGKTFITSLMAKHYDNIIILSPLRYLAFQTLEQYKKYLNNEYEPILISTDGKRNLKDINNYIKNKNIISLTYDSVDILIKIINKLKNIYIIVDEFHNLSDTNINNETNDMYKILNYDCDKIFVSATPLKNFMNIKDIYHYNWNEAIKNKYICDFNIYIPDKNEDYKLFFNMLKNTCDECLNYKLVSKAYFMLKSMLFNGDRKCICYMTTIETSNIMFNILIWLKELLNIDLEYWEINCNTKKTIRSNIINNFIKSTKIAIIINVHILDEGINIPECDSVFITQPSENMINIIQRMSRANRITEHKNNCNVYLWCKEKKTNKILNFINENTQEFIKNKVFVYNTSNKLILKHTIFTNKDYIKIENDIKKFNNTNRINNIKQFDDINQIDDIKQFDDINKLDNIIELYELLKNNININENFVNTFLKKNNIKNEIDCDIIDIKDINIYKFIDEYSGFLKLCKTNKFGICVELLIKYLNYSNSKKFYERFRKNYILNTDYIRIKTSKNLNNGKKISYFISIDCFEKICMLSRTEKGEIFRKYYINLRKFINYYK